MLPVSYRRQTGVNWCWAACGEMLFPLINGISRAQCDIASTALGRVCCGSPNAPVVCDVGAWPDHAYPPQNVPTTRVHGALSRAQVRQQLLAGKPVQACYQWAGGPNTHVALIVGEYGNGDLEVFDPLAAYGRGRRTFQDVENAYGLGRWVLTFTF